MDKNALCPESPTDIRYVGGMRENTMGIKLSAIILKAVTPIDTKNQLKTIQKIEHNLACMDYAMIFCL